MFKNLCHFVILSKFKVVASLLDIHKTSNKHPLKIVSLLAETGSLPQLRKFFLLKNTAITWSPKIKYVNLQRKVI